MRKKMMIALGLAVVMLIGITYVYAQAPGYGKMGPGYGKWSSSTPEQGTKYQELRRSFNDEAVQFGPGFGMGPDFGRGHRMGYGYGMGRGYRRGSGYGMEPSCGTYY
jgi:hypothetical protein